MPAQSRRDLATKNSASSPAHGLSDEDPGLASGQHGNGARQDALRASGAVESASADPFDVSAWMTEGLDEGFERPLPGRARLESLLGVSFAGVKLRVGVSSLDNLDAEGSYHQGELCFAETRPSDDTILHEAVHYAQAQQNGEAAGATVSGPQDDAEREADDAVAQLKKGEAVSVEQGVGGVMRKAKKKKPYGSGVRENKKRDGNRDGDKTDLGKDLVSDRAGVAINGVDAFQVNSADAEGFFDDLSRVKLSLSTNHWCLLNPAAPKTLKADTPNVGMKGDKFVLCQIVPEKPNSKPHQYGSKPKGSAWVNTSVIKGGDKIPGAVNTHRDRYGLSGDKGFDGSTKEYTFKSENERPTSSQYVKKNQTKHANKLTDYGFREHKQQNANDPTGWYNICINLSSHHSAGVANALGTPGETFVAYKSKDQKINTYKKGGKTSNSSSTFRYGHIKGDKSRYGWVWAAALK